MDCLRRIEYMIMLHDAPGRGWGFEDAITVYTLIFA